MAVLTTRKTTQVVQQNLLVYFSFSILPKGIGWLCIIFLQYRVLNASSKLDAIQLLYNLRD